VELCAPDISVPVLVIGNSADDACTPSHTHRIYEAFTHEDKELHEIKGATHYYMGPDQLPRLQEAVGLISDWLGRHGWA
jgi:alpha-beta hydrolase superfamily lysophospholipase